MVGGKGKGYQTGRLTDYRNSMLVNGQW
jgi:hypothetical protein